MGPLGAALAVLLAQESGPVPLLRFYVSQQGDDSADGRSALAEGESAPFRTLRRAFDECRELRASHGGELPAPVLIELTPGLHFLDEPLVLEPGHGGDHEHAVSVFTVPGEREATVSGGRRITGLRRAQRRGREVFVADLPEVRAGAWRFRQLFVDGKRRPRARHPDRGYLEVAALHPEDAAKPWNEGVSRLILAPGDLAALRDPAGVEMTVEMTVMCRWIESHVRVAAVAPDSGLVDLREPTVFKVDAGDPLYFEGSAGFLDAPGEWHLDAAGGELSIVPFPGEDLAAAEVIAPALRELVVLAGDPEHDRFVEWIHFERVRFAHAEWWFDEPDDPASPRAAGFPQAAVGVPGAIRAFGARDCRFERCAVEHVGGYGIELGRGCSGNRIIGCEMRDLGAGGVKIGETAIPTHPRDRWTGNVVGNSRIGDGGRIFHSAVGIWVGQSSMNTIQGNEIHDLYYTGISLGWTWGYGPSECGARVTGNHVHHIGRLADGDGPILSDMGGIYTLGHQPGTSISRNWFHDIAARRYGGWGIYFDEGSREIDARGNLVVNTTHGGFHQHYGQGNLVSQNVFAWGRDAQIQRTRCEPHTSFRFEKNVVLWREGELFAGDLSDGRFEFADNVYWREDGAEIRFAGRTFAEWQSAGFDAGSVVADPGFQDSAAGLWSIGEDSPAARLLERGVFVRPVLPITPWSGLERLPR